MVLWQHVMFCGNTLLRVQLAGCASFATYWETLKNEYIDRDVNYPFLLFDCNETWIFSTDFRKILKIQISSKSVRWEASCFVWGDGQTDRRTGGRTDWYGEANSCCLLFYNAPKNYVWHLELKIIYYYYYYYYFLYRPKISPYLK